MVTIGTLSWKVQVEKAADAKEKAKDVAEEVKNVKEEMEGADEKVGGVTDKFSALEGVQKAVGKGFDKLNAKAGFLGTALAFVKGMALAVIGVLTLKAALITGVLVGAIAGLAIAWKENLGGIQDKAGEFKDFLMDEWGALRAWLNRLWESIIEGFKASGVTMEDVGILLEAVLVGVGAAFKAAWAIIRPVLSALGKIIVFLGRVVAEVFGTVIKWLARLEERTGIFSKLAAVIGTVIGVIAGLVATVAILIKIFAVVAKVGAVVVGALNPISLVILAIIAVVILLAEAWENNWFGIRDVVANSVDFMRDKFDSFMDFLRGLPQRARVIFDNFASMITNVVRAAFNAAVPDTITLPSTTLSAPDWAGGYSATIGGQTLDLPQLHTGGLIEESGIAEVHEGEAVIPADIVQAAENGEGSGGVTKVDINLGGIEIGDQSLDIRDMSRMELQNLAKLIAEELGDEVRSVIT